MNNLSSSLNEHEASAIFNHYNQNRKSFEQTLADAGVENVPTIQINPNKFQRFGKDQKYSVSYDGNFGYFKDWSGEFSEIFWFLEASKSILTFAERKKLDEQIEIEKKLRDQELKRAQEQAKIKATQVFQNLSDNGDSPYLVAKKLLPVDGIKFGCDEKGNFIATALIDENGEISTLQKIYDDGTKRFLSGGRKNGCYTKFGNNGSNLIYVCEGLATGLSILLAKPDALIIVAYDCGNLRPVIQNISGKYSDRKIIIAGDNDLTKPRNIGKEKAEEVAKEFGFEAVFPTFKNTSSNPSDFNDLHQLEGIEEVKKQLTPSEAKDHKHNTVKVVSIKDLLSAELAQREYIIEPIFPKQGLIMIYAKRGIGKTFFALHLACSIAGGCDIFGRWKVEKSRRVLYIDGEMPANTMQERLAVLIGGLSNEIFDDRNLQIITPDFQTDNFGQMPDLSKEDGQRQIEEVIEAKEIDVIVIDNLSTLCRVGKENESESWNSIGQWALKLRTQGKSIIFIHHAGKNDNQRGTSKKEDILDTVIKLKRPDDYESNQGARFEVHFEKSRGFAGADADPFEITLKMDETKVIWQFAEIEDLETKRVIELHHAGLDQRKIGEELGFSASKVNRILKKYKEEKK
jgi:putative DNA primase/helicase